MDDTGWVWWAHLHEGQRERMAGALWGLWLGEARWDPGWAVSYRGRIQMTWWRAFLDSTTEKDYLARCAEHGALPLTPNTLDSAPAHALVRAAPLAIAATRWIGLYAGERVDAFVRSHAELVGDEGEEIQTVLIALVRALMYLFLHPSDAIGAFYTVKAWLSRQGVPEDLARCWWRRCVDYANPLQPDEFVGEGPEHARGPWTLGVHALRGQWTWEQGMAAVAEHPSPRSFGAVVGVLLGTLHGVRALPRHEMDAAQHPRHGACGLRHWLDPANSPPVT